MGKLPKGLDEFFDFLEEFLDRPALVHDTLRAQGSIQYLFGTSIAVSSPCGVPWYVKPTLGSL